MGLILLLPLLLVTLLMGCARRPVAATKADTKASRPAGRTELPLTVWRTDYISGRKRWMGGRTAPGARVYVDEREVMVGPDGYFGFTVAVKPHGQHVLVKAERAGDLTVRRMHIDPTATFNVDG